MRNIEETLSDLAAGDVDLETAERRIRTVVRTFATEFESDDGTRAYRAVGESPADGTVVVAGSAPEARERVTDLVAGAGDASFEVERLD
jgi:hypothetical protein